MNKVFTAKDIEDIIACLRTAGAPVILETPATGLASDLALLAARLG